MWSGRWLNKHLKECLQSVISRSALNFSSQPALRTTVCGGLCLARCHRCRWRLRRWNAWLYTPTIRPCVGKKKKKRNSHLDFKAKIVYFTWTMGFLNIDWMMFYCQKILDCRRVSRSYRARVYPVAECRRAPSVVCSLWAVCPRTVIVGALHTLLRTYTLHSYLSVYCLSLPLPSVLNFWNVPFSVFVCCLKSFTEWGKAYIN